MATSRRPILMGIVAAALLTWGLARSEEPKTPTQTSMRGIFVTLSSAYTYSLDPVAFAAPENREQILGKLRALNANAHELETHTAGLDPSFDYLKRSLARDASDALSRFETQNYVGSRFVLSKITENCVNCHTKLASRGNFDLGAEFVEITDVKSLSPFGRASLETAARQFDQALTTYESILKSPDMKPADLQLYDVFETYLKIAIGALSDTDRPLATLSEFAKRPDLPVELKEDTESWIAELDGLNLDDLSKDKLGAARTTIENARANTRSKSDRSQLVEFIVSITLLHRYLDAESPSDIEVAEAYYLLGVAESHVTRSYWISEVDFLLEKAIRQAPHSDVAMQAYAFLEDYTHSEYRVTPARIVPDDLKVNLEELRALASNEK